MFTQLKLITNIFSCIYLHFAITDKTLTADNEWKNHDIIPGEIPADKDKNTCKKQVCNQQ